MEGIYTMYFTGRTGSSFGLLLFKNGTIAGADAGGGIYDGSYAVEAGGMLDAKVRVILPEGGSLVTGAIAGPAPMILDIPVKLPANFGNGHALPVTTPTGPINIIFKKLRDVP